MRGVRRLHHVAGVDIARPLLGDAGENPLGAGALGADRDAGIFRLERFCHLLSQRQIDRGVMDDLALFLRGLDQHRRHRLGGRSRGADGLGKKSRRSQGGSRLQHVAPVECRFHFCILISL